MTWIKKNLSFTIIMVLLAGVLGFEAYLILGQKSQADEAEDNFRGKVDEFEQLVDQSILPHPRNVALTEAEIERQREELDLYIESLEGREELDETFADHPTSGRDFVFDIQFFAEDYRERAAAATGMEAEALADEYFSFASFATSGPADDRLAEVYKERVVVAYILDRLFEAGPNALLSVRRPGGGSGGGTEGRQTGGFQLNPRLTAAIPDIAETSAYEVSFTGRASTLRTFINELASFEMPLIVRNVQVTSASDDGGGGSRNRQESSRRRRAPASSPDSTTEEEAEDEGEETVPLVADNLSRFTVAMELIDLIPIENGR